MNMTSTPKELHKTLSEVEKLADRGLFLRAYALLEPYLAHTEIEVQLLHIRLLDHLGAGRKARAMLLRLWRKGVRPGCLQLTYLRELTLRSGPFAAWNFLQKHTLPADLKPAERAEWFANQALLYGRMRDHERASHFYQLARAEDSENPWVELDWANVWRYQDRHQESLSVVQGILQKWPDFRSALQVCAELLCDLDRDEEALTLLEAAFARGESMVLGLDYMQMQIEAGLLQEARQTLHRCQMLAPLAEKNVRELFAMKGNELALRLQDFDSALQCARQVNTAYFKELTAKLEAAGNCGRWVLLPVGFVRQHLMTCVPATLSALSQYWQRPASHLEIAEQICYDGTSCFNERRWAQEQGFIAREFCVDWEVACALLDAGIPFTLTTIIGNAGHLHAVIGYDDMRRILLIRDSNQHSYIQFDAPSLLTSHGSSGPRGMLLLPAEQQHLLDDISLPEADLYDQLYALNEALDKHQREEAGQHAQRMQQTWPGHRLSLQAARTLAHYDGDNEQLLTLAQQMLALYPEERFLHLNQASLMVNLTPIAQQLEFLQQACTRHSTDAHLLCCYARLLLSDLRRSAQVEYLLRRALRYAPGDALVWNAWADLQWLSGQKEIALECHRIASCLSPANEDFARRYFHIACALRQEEAGLEYLRQRYAQWGQLASASFITLFSEMEGLGYTQQAFALLAEALQKNSGDADLVFFAIDAFLRYNKKNQAKLLLQRAHFPSKKVALLEAQAKLERETGDPAQALELALQAAEMEPFNTGLQMLACRCLAQLKGRPAAVAYLRQLCARFPHHYVSHQLLVSWMQDLDAKEVEPVLRHMFACNPQHQELRRELSANLAQQARYDEALQLARENVQMAPGSAANHSLLGRIYFMRGELELCASASRQALSLSIDEVGSMESLISFAKNLQEKAANLRFIQQQLLQQASNGDAWLAFQPLARDVLPAKDVEAFLKQAQEERPELWHTWSALAQQLSESGELEQAQTLLTAAVQKFPLCPQILLDLARIQILQNQRALALDTIQQALHISPHWVQAIELYVTTSIDHGVDFGILLKFLDDALGRNPEAVELLNLRAGLLLNRTQDDAEDKEALAIAEQSLRTAIAINPENTWPWQLLKRLAHRLAQPDLVEQVARALVLSAPGNYLAWMRLAEVLSELNEALQALERASALAPFSGAVFETRLELLLKHEKYRQLQAELDNPPKVNKGELLVRLYRAKLAIAHRDFKLAAMHLRNLFEQYSNEFRIWQMYAECCQELKDWEQLSRAGENLIRISPGSHIGHGYAGEALAQRNQLARALPYFKRAFELEPSYSFAAFHLFDDAWERGDDAQAQQVLDTLSRYENGAFLLARKFQMAFKTGDDATLGTVLHDLPRTPAYGVWPGRIVFETLKNKPLLANFIHEIKSAIGEGKCARYMMHCLIDHLIADIHERTGNVTEDALYKSLKPYLESEAETGFMLVVLERLQDLNRTWLLQALVRDFEKKIRADDSCWEEVGFLYLDANAIQTASTWLSDWRQRPDASLRALHILNLCQRRLQRNWDAYEVCKFAEQKFGQNDTILPWLILDAAVGGMRREMQEMMQKIQSEGEFTRSIIRLAQEFDQAINSENKSPALDHFMQVMQEKEGSQTAKQVARDLFQRVCKGAPWHQRLLFWWRYKLPA